MKVWNCVVDKTIFYVFGKTIQIDLSDARYLFHTVWNLWMGRHIHVHLVTISQSPLTVEYAEAYMKKEHPSFYSLMLDVLWDWELCRRYPNGKPKYRSIDEI